jgi:predicted ATPase
VTAVVRFVHRRVFENRSSSQCQGARAPELRAATSHARLLKQEGRKAEARDLLSSVYAGFTEGLEGPDLQDAAALLNGL